MRPFDIVFLALSFLSPTLCLVLQRPSSNSSERNTNVGSLDIPVRPAQALANIHVDWKNEPISARFDPAFMYYNIHTFLVTFWKNPNVAPITDVDEHQSYPDLDTWIIPAPGSNLLTSAIAASVLSRFLEQLPRLDWRYPHRLEADLTTRTQPPRPIGRIGSDYYPEFDSSMNSTSGTRSGICEDRWVAVSSALKLRLEFDGQSATKPVITPAVWLQTLTGITLQIFGSHAPYQVLDFAAPRQIFGFRKASAPRTSPWILEARIDVTPAPQGKQPLDVEELVQGVTTMLSEVAKGRCFEQLRAIIVKDEWPAATYTLSYLSGERHADSA